MKVFYSWQSDLESKYNRTFIKECLTQAIRDINNNLNLDEAIRLDQDTKGIPGTPDITNTIFKKIRDCDVFVSDVSFIGKSKNGKLNPNPNVLIELGYALGSISDISIVNIINEIYGKADGNLPFDLKHKRWPIKYSLDAGNYNNKGEIKKALVKSLVEAITPIIGLRVISKEPTSLAEDPSYDNVLNHIMFSNAKSDWLGAGKDWESTETYKRDVNLRIQMHYEDEGVQNPNFHDDWANRFPDERATGYWCDVYFGSSHIYRTILVSVDGGRAKLPIPNEFDTAGKHIIVRPLDYKIAEIMDSTESLYDYFHRSGLKLQNTGLTKKSL